jgi:hypothetical protein
MLPPPRVYAQRQVTPDFSELTLPYQVSPHYHTSLSTTTSPLNHHPTQRRESWRQKPTFVESLPLPFSVFRTGLACTDENLANGAYPLP